MLYHCSRSVWPCTGYIVGKHVSNYLMCHILEAHVIIPVLEKLITS